MFSHFQSGQAKTGQLILLSPVRLVGSVVGAGQSVGCFKNITAPVSTYFNSIL